MPADGNLDRRRTQTIFIRPKISILTEQFLCCSASGCCLSPGSPTSLSGGGISQTAARQSDRTRRRQHASFLMMEEKSFAVFYERTSHGLRRYIARSMSGDPHADDLFQESYIR